WRLISLQLSQTKGSTISTVRSRLSLRHTRQYHSAPLWKTITCRIPRKLHRQYCRCFRSNEERGLRTEEDPFLLFLCLAQSSSLSPHHWFYDFCRHYRQSACRKGHPAPRRARFHPRYAGEGLYSPPSDPGTGRCESRRGGVLS